MLTHRRLVPADLPAVARLMEAAFEPCYGEAWSREQLNGVLSLPGVWGDATLVEQDRLAGFALTRQVIDEAELLLIAVDAELRRQGLARRLVEQALGSARDHGARSIYLEVRDGNVAATCLYRAFAFEAVGRRENYYRGADGRQYDAITMRRLLTSE